MPEETEHDLYLKRINVILAILGGLAVVAVGFYNVKKAYFDKPAPPPPPPPAQSDKIRSALEDVGASWLQKLKNKNQ